MMKKTVGLLLISLAITSGLLHTNLRAQKLLAPGLQVISGPLNQAPSQPGQDSTWEGKWALVQRLILSDHSQRPILLLDSLTAVARKSGRKDYLLKSAIFRLIHQRVSTDGSVMEGLPYLDSLIHSSRESVETSLLYVTKARLLLQIYQKDKYKIDGRTVIQNNQPDEAKMDSWTKRDFYDQIHALYIKALAPVRLLQSTPNTAFNALVAKGHPGYLRPTLYDLIVSDALDAWQYYNLTASFSQTPFALDDPRMLADAATFVKTQFVLPDPGDSLNPKWLSLNLYQALLKFRLEQAQNKTAEAAMVKAKAALGDMDLLRLQWVYENSPKDFGAHTSEAATVLQGDNKDPENQKEALYKNSLQAAKDRYKGTDASLYAGYLLANCYNKDALAYDASNGANGDSTHRYDKVKALEIINSFKPELDAALAAAAKAKNKQQLSDGAALLLNLKRELLGPDYHVQVSHYNLPGEPMLAFLSFKNTRRLFCRIIRMPAENGSLNYTDSLWQVLRAMTPVKTFTRILPDTHDYQQHSAEIMLPALDKGYYLLLSSDDPDFKPQRGLAAVNFAVTSLAYISHGTDQFFLDRKTGKPLAHVKVNLFERVWNGQRVENILDTTMTADAKGHISYPKDYSNEWMSASLGGDTLMNILSVFEPFNDSDYEEDENGLDIEGTRDLIFYLDRSIYRPGQEVQFKGVATFIYQDARGRQLWTDQKQHTVYLKDANDEILDSLSLSLNDFGALNGTFHLPLDHLAGQYTIECEDLGGQQRFRVEQYKRPTYFVQLDSLKSAVAIGDSITVHGQAMAYSGYPVTGAKIDITVNRYVHFPYSWYRFLPNVNQELISHGQVQTDDKGNFSFRFKATEGQSSWIRYMPEFLFNINATATDQSGETRSAHRVLRVGSQPFNIELQVPDPIAGNHVPGNFLDTVGLITRTAEGLFTAQKVHFKITQLKAPQRLLRDRNWEAPDLPGMDSTTFVQLFPHDPYMQENDKENWPREKVVYSRQLTTTPDGKIAIDQDFPPGWYELAAEAPGNRGLTITNKQYVYLYDGANPLSSPVYNWSENGATSVLPGEKTGLTLASSIKDQYLLYSVTRMPADDASMASVTFGDSTQSGKSLTLPVRLTKEDIYGIQVDYGFIRDNRQYSGTMRVHLKDTTVQPVLVYESYRDKTEPGSQEHWTLHINKGSQPLSQMELLSAMYDASLDQFASHSWRLPTDNGANRLAASNWQSNGMFEYSYGQNYRSYLPGYGADKSYGYLQMKDWFRQMSMGGSRIMIRGTNSSLEGRVAGLAVQRTGALSQPAAEALNDVVVVGYGKAIKKELTASVTVVGDSPEPVMAPVRSDFRETAFFFPHIHSDKAGNYTLDFQMPDALTTWKWMNLAYDKKLNVVAGVKKIVSQKTLMVSPNLPRFVRNADQWTLPVKVINLGQEALNVEVAIEITDPATGKKLDWLADKAKANQLAALNAASNTTVYFAVQTPADFTGPIAVTVKAQGGQYSDAEKNLLPVLTNKLLITETLPIYMDHDGTQDFTMDQLLKGTAGNVKENKKLFFELTTNPIWQVVLALPELRAGEKSTAEQLMSGLYAEAMGAYVIRTYPKITQMIKTWAADTVTDVKSNALKSALEKNPELKSVILQQTPWVMEAKKETQQRSALVRFFDQYQQEITQRTLTSRLLGLQQSDGGFGWFSGGRSEVLSTQRILLGIKQLTSGPLKDQSLILPLQVIEQNAARYLDNYYQMRYVQWQQRLQEQKIRLKDNISALANLDTIYPVTGLEIQYLYALSLGQSHPLGEQGQKENSAGLLTEAQRQFLQAEKHQWEDHSIYLKLMMAATQYRIGDQSFGVDSLFGSAMNSTVNNATLGRYWKRGAGYYHWYENPLQSQALAISLLAEAGQGKYGYSRHPEWKDYLPQMQRYLISQKQVNSWPDTKTTIDACMAMIASAPGELDSKRVAAVQLGNKKLDLKQQAGTGYIRYEVAGEDITPDMGKITLQIKGMGKQTGVPVYGGLYWQYVSPVKAVEAAAKSTGISLQKGLYREITSGSGKQLVAVKSGDILEVGDKLVSRLIIQVDRDMDYIHLREMRAAGVQPDQNISNYQYQDGISYYQAIGDMTTDLYFDHINKGTYVIEYPVHVSHAGSFAAGTASAESFYAPEFATHTEGIRLQTKQPAQQQ